MLLWEQTTGDRSRGDQKGSQILPRIFQAKDDVGLNQVTVEEKGEKSDPGYILETRANGTHVRALVKERGQEESKG